MWLNINNNTDCSKNICVFNLQIVGYLIIGGSFEGSNWIVKNVLLGNFYFLLFWFLWEFHQKVALHYLQEDFIIFFFIFCHKKKPKSIEWKKLLLCDCGYLKASLMLILWWWIIFYLVSIDFLMIKCFMTWSEIGLVILNFPKILMR